MTHAADPNVTATLEALASAIGPADGASAEYFTELLEIGLGDSPARTIWRTLLSRGTFFPGRGTIVEESYLKGVEEGREEGREEGLEAGRVEARAQMILRVLEKRQIPTLETPATALPAAPTSTASTSGWTGRSPSPRPRTCSTTADPAVGKAHRLRPASGPRSWRTVAETRPGSANQQ
jgi:hypothetical protein